MVIPSMNLEELFTSAKNKRYTKRLIYISILGIAMFGSFMFIDKYLEPTGNFKVLCVVGAIISLLVMLVGYVKWGVYSSNEIFVSKFKDKNIGQLKDLYKTYSSAPVSSKVLEEKIFLEQIMVDIALNFRNLGAFVEPFTDVEAKGLKHNSDSIYSFIAMTENVSIEDRLKVYILDNFFTIDYFDDVELESIKF